MVIWPITVGDFVNTGRRFQNVGNMDMHNLYVCMVKFANTGWRCGQYRRRYIFQDLGRFEVETRDSKNMGGLRIMPRYGIKNKKNQFGYRSAPLSILCPINYIR